jgi:hypothetical protein
MRAALEQLKSADWEVNALLEVVVKVIDERLSLNWIFKNAFLLLPVVFADALDHSVLEVLSSRQSDLVRLWYRADVVPILN